jgi:type IV secretory pathway TrbF-like protein
MAKRHPNTEEMALMNKLARLSAQERRQIISDFVDEVFGGLAADPQLEERMRAQTPDLPDDPSPEQVNAWVELAELVQDPQFRQIMRRMAEDSSHRRAVHRLEPGSYLLFAKRVGDFPASMS